MSEEEKKAIEYLKDRQDILKNNMQWGTERAIEIILNLIEKQEKLINIFIHNEAVKEGKDFNEIKEKYYECL